MTTAFRSSGKLWYHLKLATYIQWIEVVVVVSLQNSGLSGNLKRFWRIITEEKSIHCYLSAIDFDQSIRIYTSTSNAVHLCTIQKRNQMQEALQSNWIHFDMLPRAIVCSVFLHHASILPWIYDFLLLLFCFTVSFQLLLKLIKRNPAFYLYMYQPYGSAHPRINIQCDLFCVAKILPIVSIHIYVVRLLLSTSFTIVICFDLRII